MTSFGYPAEFEGFPDDSGGEIQGEHQLVITPRGWDARDSDRPTKPMRAVGRHGEAPEADDDTEPDDDASGNDMRWPYDPDEERRRIHAAVRAETRRETGRNIRTWGCGFLAGALVLTMGGFVLFGRAEGGQGHPAGNVPGIGRTYTPPAGRTPGATATSTPPTKPATPTPKPPTPTPTPPKPPTPTPTNPPTPTPNTGPQWGVTTGSTPTYNSPSTSASQGSPLPGNTSYGWVCQIDGFDRLQSPPSGAAPFAPANDVELAGPLPGCETASASPAQATALASLALGGPLAAWRPEA